MFGLIGTISQWAINFLSQGGYLGVFLLSIADRISFQFIPGEIIFSLLGFLVSQTRFDFVLALTLTVVGNLIGDIMIYLASLKWGRRFVEKYGKHLFVSRHELSHTEQLFEKHGSKLIFFGRFIPIVVTFISIPAGLARMDFRKFVFYTVMGSIPRNFILVYGGFKAGQNWQSITEFFVKGQSVIILVLTVGVVWYIYRHLKRRHATH